MIYLKIIIVLIILYVLICYWLFTIMSKAKNRVVSKGLEKNLDAALSPYKDFLDKGLKWIEKQDKESIIIESFDGTKLHGIFIKNPKSKGTFILSHGYRSTKERDLFASSDNYYDLGYNLLLIDQRGCGESEGKYITFGYKESKDLDCWIEYIYKREKGDIVLGGISMGATTILLVNNKYVKAIISDSAFANGWDQIKYCMYHYVHIPAFLFLPGVNLFAILIGGFNLKKVDTKANLSKIDVPILFIHGKADDFVPCDSAISNYEYYKGKKDILLVDEANHGLSYFYNSKEYLKKIKDIIK